MIGSFGEMEVDDSAATASTSATGSSKPRFEIKKVGVG